MNGSATNLASPTLERASLATQNHEQGTTEGVYYPSLGSGSIPSLNGWRAVCILLVILHHSKWVEGGPEWKVSGMGGLGVRFFFIISGFLITTLMLRETSSKGGVDIRAFYKRRCIRILPVYYAFLLVILLLDFLTPYSLSKGEWLANLTFTKNYFGADWTTAHLWSLGVEQQFYLLWPFAFRALRPTLSPRRATLWLLLPMILCPILFAIGTITGIGGPLGLSSFLLNADSLSTGCMLAIILWHWGDRVGEVLHQKRLLLFCFALLAVALPLWLILVVRGHFFAIAFSFPTFQNIGIALLLALSIQSSRHPLLRWLEWRPIAALGVISYSVYIWQALFCTSPHVFGFPKAWWNSFPLWIVSSLAAGVASYFIIERPLLRLRASSRSRTNV